MGGVNSIDFLLQCFFFVLVMRQHGPLSDEADSHSAVQRQLG